MVVLASAFALGAAGCGGGSSGPKTPSDAVKTFWSAVAAKDGKKACGLLLPAAQRSLEAKFRPLLRKSAPCERVVVLLKSSGKGVKAQVVKGDSARVNVADGTAEYLNKVDGDWKLSGLSCKVRPRKARCLVVPG